MAVFNFDRGFWLLLTGGERIRFEPGPQTVPDEIADHWYLAANGTRVASVDDLSEQPIDLPTEPTDDLAATMPVENVTEDPDGSLHVDTPDEVSEKAALQAQALALGVEVDRRWGVARLQSEIAAKSAA